MIESDMTRNLCDIVFVHCNNYDSDWVAVTNVHAVGYVVCTCIQDNVRIVRLGLYIITGVLLTTGGVVRVCARGSGDHHILGRRPQ